MTPRLQPLLGAGRSVGLPSRDVLAGLAVLLLNVLVARDVASSGTAAAVLVLGAVAAVPVVWVMVARPTWILYAALVVTMLAGAPNELATMLGVSLNAHLPAAGGTRIFPADLLVLLAIGGAVARALTRHRGEARTRIRTIVLTWPYAFLVLTLMQGVIRGHDRYGTSYVSQPIRIFVYAAIGLTFAHERPQNLLRNVTRVFYLVVVVSSLEALYYLATGTSQTDSSALSTGGTRVLALSTAMFLAAALVLALVHLDLDPRGPHRRLHVWMALLASFGIVVSLGRTTFAAVGVLVPVLVVALRRLRRTLLVYLPVLAALAVLAVALTIAVAPSTAKTVANRFTGKVGTDTAVIQRQRKYAATMHGFGDHPLLGLGFGRPVKFVAVDRTVVTFSGDPENSYIYVLAGGGILALTALLVLIGVYYLDVARRFVRTRGEERALVVFGASLAFILLVNAVSGPVLSNPPLMLLTWIGLLLPAVAGRSRVRSA